MSWNISLIGKPENVIKSLTEHSEKLTGMSKEEYDKVLPSMVGILEQNFSKNIDPVVHVIASGHGYSTDGVPQHSQCFVEIKGLSGSLV